MHWHQFTFLQSNCLFFLSFQLCSQSETFRWKSDDRVRIIHFIILQSLNKSVCSPFFYWLHEGGAWISDRKYWESVSRIFSDSHVTAAVMHSFQTLCFFFRVLYFLPSLLCCSVLCLWIHSYTQVQGEKKKVHARAATASAIPHPCLCIVRLQNGSFFY